MGDISKGVFKGFADSECKRRLFWDLGQGNLAWVAPFREPERPEFHRLQALQLGHDYEQLIYRALLRLPGTRASQGRDGKVVSCSLSSADLAAPAVLLEHEWTPPAAFFAHVLGVPAGGPLPCSGTALRPDLLLVQARTGPASELLPGGQVVPVPEGDSRLMLRVCDIKHTSQANVGRSHFAELLFYAHALSFWLVEQGLEKLCFVPTEGHCILPVFAAEELAGIDLERLLEGLAVPMHWEHTRILFEGTCASIRELVAGLPLNPDQVPVRVQASCRSCNYINDCIVSLKRGAQDAGEWDFRLLPHTAPAVAELLEKEGFRTVRDIAEKLPIVPEHDHYDPLYAERPLLRLKARAVMNQERIPASFEELGQHQYSMALPRSSELSLFFDVEADPANDVVFGTALRLDIGCPPSRPWAPIYEAWWAAWRTLLSECSSLTAMRARLDEVRAVLGMVPEGVDRLLEETAAALFEMNRDKNIEFRPPTEGALTRVTWTWNYVSDGIEPEKEVALATEMLGQLHACISLCNAMESLLLAPVEQHDGREWISKPSLAIFYWSAEQVDAVRDMLERCYLALNLHAPSVQHLRDLLYWIAPTESQITHYDHRRKFFDLRAFVETTQGVPHLINCTWHALLESETGWTSRSQFWAPHFNLMDFSAWHAALEETNATRKYSKLNDIGKELLQKLRGLFQLMLTLRKDGRELLTLREGVATRQLREPPVGTSLNPLARIFYMYSRLNAAVQAIEADEIRLSYPSRGIGRLKAALVSEPRRLAEPAEDKKAWVGFGLGGMSAGVRLRENDHVLLMPESARSDRVLRDWGAILDTMAWDPQTRRYRCKALVAASTADELERLGETEAVYLYPTSTDTWSGRLLDNKEALLRRHGARLGRSWLGSRLAALLGVDGNQPLDPPSSLSFSTAELFYYAPALLPVAPLAPDTPLKTTAHPTPDPSQREAILRSLGRHVTCLQGPPGTGKSQTIAALIDEHLQRAEGPFRILVTAFSYDAMLVLARKLCEHQNAQQQPTKAGALQKVFAVSKGRELELPAGVHTLELAPKAMTLDGQKLERSKKRRLTSYLEERFVLFANAHALFHLGLPSEAKSAEYELLPDGFGWDLIIVDEASQLPTDQFLAAAALVHPGTATLAFTSGEPSWDNPEPARLEAMTLCNPEVLRTRIVVVGDQNQLPPVQPVEPPRKLRKVLGSFFHYLLEGHHLEPWQLQVNYRSTDTIVEYTRQLALYGDLFAWHKDHPHRPLPPAPKGLLPWLAAVLDPALEVHAIIHHREGERASSPLEAKLAAEVIFAFHQQLAPADADAEERFWKEEVGVVAPHNAQGRLILQRVQELFAQHPGRSKLPQERLDALLRQAIYSVEKFQGSDRTFIIASMGVSAKDQLSAEESFIYGLNRFNVLTSRAKQKLLLLCSRNFLSHIPTDRELLGNAALIRRYALDFCDQAEGVEVQNEEGQAEGVVWRWRAGYNGPAKRIPNVQGVETAEAPPHEQRRAAGLEGLEDSHKNGGTSVARGGSNVIESLFARVGFSPNESQRQAIEHLDGPLFLVAGPGSGKTRVLLWRVVNMIVFHGVAPESIFLSTFTEKAAKQLQDGLVSLLGLASEQTGKPYDLSGMYVGTVHALCHRLLQDRSLVVDRERSTAPAVLDELDQYFTLAQGSFWSAAKALLAFEGELPAFRETVNANFEPPASASRHKAVVNLQSLFNRLSEEDLDPKDILDKAPEGYASLFRLYQLYRDRLGNSRVDLSLLQRAAYRFLLANDGTMSRFKHVIVDEYQDTNAIQERIFFRLSGGSKNICVVGDDDQALYRFRGATVENFVEFPKRCVGALGVEPRRIELGINYRSRRGIVQAYTSFVVQHDWSRPGGGQFRLHDKGVRAHSIDDSISVVTTAPSKPADIADEIATLCRRLIDEKIVADPNQIAFLFPTLKSTIVEKFEEALGRVGLRVYAPRAKRFLEADEPTLIIGLLTRVLGKPPRNEAFDRGEYGEFHSWLDSATTVADSLMDSDPTLRTFVEHRVAELVAIKRDYAALKAVLDQGSWSEDAAYDPNTHKRPLLNAAGLSADARRALGGAGLEKLYKERLAEENPLSLKNVINRATTADWGLLDLFYRFLGFQRFREMVDLADGGIDEAPICNLALTSQLLARYVDTFPPLITGQGLATEMLQRGFYQAFLFALFRMGEGEYEDAEDPFPRGRIPFLTIHQSKGLEFPVVVLGSARTNRRVRKVEELVRPLLPPGGEPLDRMPGFDAMRMFYVALSRAQNLLVLAHPKGQGQKVDAEFHELMDKAAPIAGFDVRSVPKAKQEPDAAVRRFSYTSDYLAYQRCPRQYMLFERYGFAASRTQTMFFGSLIHATLEDLHHRMIAARKAKKAAEQAGSEA